MQAREGSIMHASLARCFCIALFIRRIAAQQLSLDQCGYIRVRGDTDNIGKAKGSRCK